MEENVLQQNRKKDIVLACQVKHPNKGKLCACVYVCLLHKVGQSIAIAIIHRLGIWTTVCIIFHGCYFNLDHTEQITNWPILSSVAVAVNGS